MLNLSTANDTATDTVQSTASSTATDAVQNKFDAAISMLDTGKNHKITFYLSDSEIETLEDAMGRYSIKRNAAMKLAIAALADKLET